MRNRTMMAMVALALGGLPSLTAAQTGKTAVVGKPLATQVARTAKSRAQDRKTGEASKPLDEVIATEEAGELASDAALQVTNWVIASGDNRDLPFIVIDKVGAEIFVFDADGQFVGSTPALLGVTRGDDSTPGVGDRELSDIPVEDRTTPAGRFMAGYGPASGNRRVLWVDYETAISLHPVITANPKERRPQRLRSPTPKDNRITFGCINISPAFYTNVVRKLFRDEGGVVYILPETRSLAEAFPTFRARSQLTSRDARER